MINNCLSCLIENVNKCEVQSCCRTWHYSCLEVSWKRYCLHVSHTLAGAAIWRDSVYNHETSLLRPISYTHCSPALKKQGYEAIERYLYVYVRTKGSICSSTAVVVAGCSRCWLWLLLAVVVAGCHQYTLTTVESAQTTITIIHKHFWLQI